MTQDQSAAKIVPSPFGGRAVPSGINIQDPAGTGTGLSPEVEAALEQLLGFRDEVETRPAIPAVSPQPRGFGGRQVPSSAPSDELKGGVYLPEQAIALLNAKFFIAEIPGKYPIAERKGELMNYIAPEDFARLLANVTVSVPGKNGRVDLVKGHTFWLNHPNREKRQIIFNSKQPPGFSVPGKYNLWQGLAVVPQKGWCKQRKLLRHIRQIICCRDKQSFKYLLRWLACSVQRPDEIPETVIVLKSREEGTGKSTLTSKVMCKIFGKVHSRTISDSDLLVTRFNDDLENAVFIDGDEMLWAGDKHKAGKLRSLITSPSRRLEVKGGKSWHIDNRLHIMMTTNEEHAVQSGVGDRRFFVLEVGPEKAKDKTWFGPMQEDLDNGGLEQFLWLLLNLNLKGWHPREKPTTQASIQQQRYSGDSISQWVQACIDADCVRTTTMGDIPLNSKIQTDHLFESYKAHGRGHHASVNRFGRAMTEMLGAPVRGPKTHNANSTTRPRLYSVPDADTWQQALDKRMGV